MCWQTWTSLQDDISNFWFDVSRFNPLFSLKMDLRIRRWILFGYLFFLSIFLFDQNFLSPYPFVGIWFLLTVTFWGEKKKLHWAPLGSNLSLSFSLSLFFFFFWCVLSYGIYHILSHDRALLWAQKIHMLKHGYTVPFSFYYRIIPHFFPFIIPSPTYSDFWSGEDLIVPYTLVCYIEYILIFISFICFQYVCHCNILFFL